MATPSVPQDDGQSVTARINMDDPSTSGTVRSERGDNEDETARLLGEPSTSDPEITEVDNDNARDSGGHHLGVDDVEDIEAGVSRADGDRSTSDPEITEAGQQHPRRNVRSGLLGMWDRIVSLAGQPGEGRSDAELDVVDAVVDATDDIEKQAPSSSATNAISNNPVCLICLEQLSQADFASGEAISLECGCRGDLALRHKECAIKWSQVKDDGQGGLPQCELCKKPVKNLPELPRRERERPAANSSATMPPITIEEAFLADPQFEQFVPSRADIMFDCVRVTWIAMIVSILFFDANMSLALISGMVAGMAYLLMLRLLYKQHFESLRAYAEAQQQASAAFPPRMIIRI